MDTEFTDNVILGVENIFVLFLKHILEWRGMSYACHCSDVPLSQFVAIMLT